MDSGQFLCDRQGDCHLDTCGIPSCIPHVRRRLYLSRRITPSVTRVQTFLSLNLKKGTVLCVSHGTGGDIQRQNNKGQTTTLQILSPIFSLGFSFSWNVYCLHCLQMQMY